MVLQLQAIDDALHLFALQLLSSSSCVRGRGIASFNNLVAWREKELQAHTHPLDDGKLMADILSTRVRAVRLARERGSGLQLPPALLSSTIAAAEPGPGPAEPQPVLI